MIDKLSEWAWGVPSIDEYWDNILRDNHSSDHPEIVRKLPDGNLKEYLLEKIKYGVGKSIIITRYARSKKKYMTFDIRDFETYLKVIDIINQVNA